MTPEPLEPPVYIYTVEHREILYDPDGTTTHSDISMYLARTPEKARAYIQRNLSELQIPHGIAYYAITGDALEDETGMNGPKDPNDPDHSFLEFWGPDGTQIPGGEATEDWLIALRAKDPKWYKDNHYVLTSHGSWRCQAAQLEYATKETWPTLATAAVTQLVQEDDYIKVTRAPFPNGYAELADALKQSISRMAPLLSAKEKSKFLASLDQFPSAYRAWFIPLVGTQQPHR